MLRAINNLEEGFGYVILQVYYVTEDLTGLNYDVNIRAPLAIVLGLRRLFHPFSA